MKAIILVCDGMADRPNAESKTPLSEARTPNFDCAAHEGVTGMMDVLREGATPNSDTGHLALLGYDLEKYYPGRGPLEALGSGLHMEEGDLAFRANIATVDANLNVIDRRAGRIRGDLSELEKKVNAIDIGLEFEFKHTVDHRGALVLREANAVASDTDPHEEDVRVLESTGDERVANAVNKFTLECKTALGKLDLNKDREKPANMILLRGAGLYKEAPSFETVHGLKGAVIAAVALVRGAAKYTGLELLEVEGMTGNEHTNIKSKFEAAVNALENHDLVLVNVKAPDIFGHDGKWNEKVNIIEKIDSELPILLESGAVVTILSDHATPVEDKNHSADPVPVIIYGAGEKDAVQSYSEKACSEGKLKRMHGVELIPLLKKYQKE